MPSLAQVAEQLEQRSAEKLNAALIGRPCNQVSDEIAAAQEAGRIIQDEIRRQTTSGALPSGTVTINAHAGTSTSSSEQIWHVWIEGIQMESVHIDGALSSSTTDTYITLYGASGSTIRIVGERVWFEWNRPLTATTNHPTIITNTEVWEHWIRADQILVPPRVSEEERARREAEQRRWREQEEQARREQAEANERAELLLRQHLTPQQNDDLQRKGCFFLYVGDKKYRVRRGQSGNVELVDTKVETPDIKGIHRYCIHPGQRVPDADAMLAQKLLLEANESEFLRIANRHW